jgi:hypothetical protein
MKELLPVDKISGEGRIRVSRKLHTSVHNYISVNNLISTLYILSDKQNE